jgi:hypothetical protein
MQTLTSEEIATYRSRPHFFVVYWLHNETGGFLLGQASGETQWALQTYVVFDDYTHPVAQENNEVKFVQLLHGIHYATQSSAKTTQLAQWLDGRQRNALKHRADYTTREFVLQPIRDWAQRTRREKETKAQEEAERVEHEEAEKRRLALLVHVPEHHVGPKRPHTRKLKSGRIIQVKESRPHIRHAHTKGPKDGPLSISLKQIKPSEKKPNEST